MTSDLAPPSLEGPEGLSGFLSEAEVLHHDVSTLYSIFPSCRILFFFLLGLFCLIFPWFPSYFWLGTKAFKSPLSSLCLLRCSYPLFFFFPERRLPLFSARTTFPLFLRIRSGMHFLFFLLRGLTFSPGGRWESGLFPVILLRWKILCVYPLLFYNYFFCDGRAPFRGRWGPRAPSVMFYWPVSLPDF